MAKLGRKELIEKINELKETNLITGDIPESAKVQELKGLIAEAEDLLNQENPTPIDLSEYFEIAEDDKKWYLKDSFFNKNKYGIKKNGKGMPPEQIKIEVDYCFLNFSGGKREKFFKNKPLTEEQLLLFDTAPNSLLTPLREETEFIRKTREQRAIDYVENRKKICLEYR